MTTHDRSAARTVVLTLVVAAVATTGTLGAVGAAAGAAAQTDSPDETGPPRLAPGRASYGVVHRLTRGSR